jgi:hypothetical protein
MKILRKNNDSNQLASPKQTDRQQVNSVRKRERMIPCLHAYHEYDHHDDTVGIDNQRQTDMCDVMSQPAQTSHKTL